MIRRITQSISARDAKVIPVAAPSDEELAHHYLWRFWRRIPRDGQMRIFDRSWYGRVLVERVEGLARVDEWQRAYEEINDFEAQLCEHGTPVMKFWLHIDPDEQLRRFRAREQTEYKKYKITEEDYRNRERWPDYSEAINEMVERTSTRLARGSWSAPTINAGHGCRCSRRCAIAWNRYWPAGNRRALKKRRRPAGLRRFQKVLG